LLDGLFAHPAWQFSVVQNLDICDGYRGQNEFIRSLLVESREETVLLNYSRSRYTALYIAPRTAVRASNAKNIVIIDLHLLSSDEKHSSRL
jgi:hypothetical protein